MSKSEELYYVHLSEARKVRTNILEASKQLIDCLRRYEKFKDIRAQRITAAEDLMQTLKDINDLTSQMKIDVPKIKIPEVKIKHEELKEPVQVEEHDELHKLEAAIAEIESRLGDIK